MLKARNIESTSSQHSLFGTYVRIHSMVFLVSDCTWQAFSRHKNLSVDRDSVKDVATCYGLDGPVNESWLG